jgi:hypothetical protein
VRFFPSSFWNVTDFCQDPGLAPASKLILFTLVGCIPLTTLLAGTPEAGGWTTRELKRIIRGLAGLNFVYVLLLPVFSILTIEDTF